MWFLGGDYMVPVGQDEVLSRFSGIPAVLYYKSYPLHKLYPVITCEKFDSGKAGSLFCTTGMKFSHEIASARLSEMKKWINTLVWKNPWKYASIDRRYFYCIFTTHMTSVCEKKNQQMSLQNFIILWIYGSS